MIESPCTDSFMTSQNSSYPKALLVEPSVIENSVSEDSVNEDSVNINMVNEDSVNDDSVNDDSVNEDSIIIRYDSRKLHLFSLKVE